METESNENRSQIGELIETLSDGDIAREADEDLRKVLTAVEDTGMKGSITITIAIERKRHGQMILRPSVSAKVPRQPTNASVRYLTPKGELLEDDPSQREFEFSNVTPIKENGTD